MWYNILAGYIFLTTITADQVHNAVETEMFAIPISPNLFNWTYQEYDQQYRFHASLIGKPELPSWLRYIYSRRHHSGFIFGTPPRGTKSPVTLEIIGLNSQDYETRRVRLTLLVIPKDGKARHEVEFKIDNLNTEDLLDEHKMTRLKDILRTKLWTESNQDLYPTFLASAIDLGARLPLKPSDGEGLVVRLGSVMPFSEELKRLREEVRPLSKLPSCPREYKRTTVERLFRDAGFTLDWCWFELYNVIYNERTTELLEYLTEIPNTSKQNKSAKELDRKDIWTAPSRHALPSRSYAKQLTAAVAVPLLLLLMSVAALTAVLCFHYATMQDATSEIFIKDIFHVCIDYRERKRTSLCRNISTHHVESNTSIKIHNSRKMCEIRAADYGLKPFPERRAMSSSAHKAAKVELCRYGTANTEQTQVADNNSSKSIGASPNNSLVRPYSPKSTTNLAGNYNRPQPPPYVGSTTNSLHHRKSTADKTTPSTSGHTPEHRHVLEESIKLLNEANITTDFEFKDPIVDITDGIEDYVPVKPDSTGYISMKQDLDDINVPELSKYGLGGMVGSI